MRDQEATLEKAKGKVSRLESANPASDQLVETVATLREVMAKTKEPEDLARILPCFISMIEISEDEATIGLFEQPYRWQPSIADQLGNAMLQAK